VGCHNKDKHRIWYRARRHWRSSSSRRWRKPQTRGNAQARLHHRPYHYWCRRERARKRAETDAKQSRLYHTQYTGHCRRSATLRSCDYEYSRTVQHHLVPQHAFRRAHIASACARHPFDHDPTPQHSVDLLTPCCPYRGGGVASSLPSSTMYPVHHAPKRDIERSGNGTRLGIAPTEIC